MTIQFNFRLSLRALRSLRFTLGSALEFWNSGTLELWNIETLEHWNIGTLEHWNPEIPESVFCGFFVFSLRHSLFAIHFWLFAFSRVLGEEAL